ncbi:MAG TPA: hypothetical protein VIB59_01860 [Solirubrobacteraceae bacterium]
MHGSPGTVVLGFAGNGLTFVVVGTVAFSLVISVLFLVTRGSDSMYDQIGQGGLSKESEYEAHGGGRALGSAAAGAEQEQEIRQMLLARSERRVSRGESALDIDAEVARLLGDAQRAGEHDPALVAEVRQLVEARNERRLRQGKEALDVEAEIARTLEELGG